MLKDRIAARKVAETRAHQELLKSFSALPDRPPCSGQVPAPSSSAPVPWSSFAAFAAREARPEALGIAIAGLGALALNFAIPVVTARIFDRMVPLDDHGTLSEALVVMAAALLSLHLFDLFAAGLRLRLQTRLSINLRASILERLLKLPASVFRNHSIGDLITRSGLADAEADRLLMASASNLISGAFAASSLLVLFCFDSRFGIMSLGAGMLYLGIAARSYGQRRVLEHELLETTSALRSFLFQIFGGISKIRCFGAESWIVFRWAELFRSRRVLEFRSSRAQGVAAAIHATLPGTLIGATFWALQSKTPGSAMAILASTTLYLGGLQRLASAFGDSVGWITALQRVRPFLELPVEGAGFGPRSLTLRGAIEFQGVSHRYSPEGPLILDNVSVRIEPGQFIALVGSSGSGKSTFVKLLLGLDVPARGRVLYDGIPLSELKISEVRRQIGTVLQQDHLISGSLYENIAAIRPVSLDEAAAAAQVAGLSRDLKRMPMGMQTLVTQGSRAFSGGERQRLMIARAVAGRPRILVFDEATSSLDNQVQEEVMRNIEELRVTRIFVAHRLSTIKNADQILVFERGCVVGVGTFQELLNRNKVFTRLASGSMDRAPPQPQRNPT